MARKGYTEDLLPKRDKAQGAKDIEAQRRAEDTPAGWSVGGEGRPSHPDGWQTGGR